MAFSGPSVTFCFGSDSRVTLPESLLSSLPAGGITFGSFTDSAYVTFGGPTPSEAAAFSPPQRRGRAAMRPFGRPVARQPARAAACPAPVVRAQPVRPVARQPAPRPLPVQPVRPDVRRPAPTVPVVRPAPAPQRRQPVVPLAVVPVEATRARVSPPPSSSRKRGAQAELPSPSSHRVSVFARLSHSETARQTPVTSVVAPVPPVQSVGLDVASSSTSGLGRRARRNRNRRLRLAASEAAVQEMIVSVAQQEPVQRRVVPSQREPRRPTVVHTPDVVVAPEIDAVQGGRFSPLVHSGDEEDAGRIAAAPPVTTTLPRARVPRDGAARALTQRIRSIVRSARGRGRVSEERLLREISQVHFQLQRQSVRQSYQWRRGQPPRQSTRPVVTARPLTDAPSVGRRPRRHGRRPPSEPVRSQLGSVVVVPPPQPDVPSTSRRSRWVWRRRQVDQPVETEQTVGTVRRVDTVVPSVAAAVPMICDRAADDVEFVPSVSPPVRVESAGVSDRHGASSPMGPHIDALCQTFSEDDWLGEESEEDVPVHRVCVVTRRGTSDEHRDMDDDMEEQGEADVPSTSAQGGPPRSVDTDATVLQLQAQMAEMARAMATMTAQLTALGVAPQVMEVGTPTTSRDEPVVPPVVVPDPVRVERVQRAVSAVPPTVTFSTPVQTQSVQMSPGQIQDMITQKVGQAISSRKSGDSVSRGRPYPIEYERESYPAGFVPPRFRVFDGLGNPRQHVAQYRAVCCNIGGNDALMLRLFVSSLGGVAFEWYADLPNDSVYTFAELEQLFIQRFISTEYRVTVGELVVTRQRPHESLLNYIVRWRNLSLQCEPQLQEQHAVEILLKNIDGPIAPYLKGFSIKTFQKLLTKVTSLQDSIPSAVPPKVESQPLRRPQRQEFSGAPPPPRKADVHSTFEVQDKGKRPVVSSVPQRPPPPPRPQFPPRPQLPPQAPAQPSGQFQPRPPVQQSRPPYRTPEKHQYLQERLNKEYPFKRESSEQCGSQHSSQSSDSGEPLSSGEEWQLALSRKTRGMIRQAVQSSEAVERRPPQAKSTVASTFTLPVSSSPSSVVVHTEHISPSSCIRKMYEREKLVVTSEGKTGSLPALTLKDFVLPPIDDELMEEDDSGYFWSLCVPSSSRSHTRSFHVLSISDDDVVSLHEEEFECDEPVFTIPEGGCYMDSGDESEGTPQPLLVEATQAMTLEPNESPDEFDSVQEIQLRSGKGPSQVCIEADVSTADHVRSPFQFAVGHDVPPSRGRGWRGRGRSRDSDCPARNLYSRVPPPSSHPFSLTVESDSDDEMIDIVHRPAPLQSLSFADYNAFPTVRRHLIPEGGLVIDGGSDDDADVGRQDTSRQSFPHPKYGMRVEGSSQQPSPVPPATSVRGPLYSDSPSVHELHTLYVPPRPGWHASLFHSVGVPQSTDTPGFVESTVDDEITFAPRLSSPFVDSCVERGLVPTTWTDGQARQQARVWRTDLPQTTRGVFVLASVPTNYFGDAAPINESFEAFGSCYFSFFPHVTVVVRTKWLLRWLLLLIHRCEYGQVNIELFSFAVANMVRRMLNPSTSPTLCLAVANMVRRTQGCPHSPLRIWSGECWSFSFFCPAVANMVKQTLDFREGSLFTVANMVRWIMSYSHSLLRIWSGECRISLFWLGARQSPWGAYFTTSSFPLFLFPAWGLLSSLCDPLSRCFDLVRRTLGRPHSPLRIWSSECWTLFLSFVPLLRIWSGGH
ncbi:hypothetical protein M5K25_008701 [Dendrobium thyrsiflorum]|uniref:Retrotransposon gag domain-containing protein n=1 Tax=Dendrobium thyrsiflorum TaxID=117978 RepID=A0ABD0VG56_DENTH